MEDVYKKNIKSFEVKRVFIFPILVAILFVAMLALGFTITISPLFPLGIGVFILSVLFVGIAIGFEFGYIITAFRT